jgi:hypothetical protein
LAIFKLLDLYILKISLWGPDFGSFYDFFLLFSDFMLLSFVISYCLFYFLGEVGFLVYLRICKSLKEEDLMIAILEKINL